MSIDMGIPEINAEVGRARRDQRVPRLSAAVVHDQEIIWAGRSGQANLEERVPASPQTIYLAASITKLFTSTMLMQLRDGGELQLDDPIRKYLPAFEIKSRFADPRPPTFRQVASPHRDPTRTRRVLT